MTIKTADGYRLEAGERAFNYYDMYPGTIGDIDSEGWFTFTGDNGKRAVLNGERVCSLESAERKGWYNSSKCYRCAKPVGDSKATIINYKGITLPLCMDCEDS